MKKFLLPFLMMLVAAACAPTRATDSGRAESAILTSTTILADIARNIAGDRLTVVSLLSVGADPHSYQPTPQDMAKIEGAPLIIINGAEYEHFLEAVLENADAELIVEASAGLTPRTAESGEHGVDPHLWLDPNLVSAYVENIRAALTAYDPAGAEMYRANADAYVQQLKELDAWIQAQVKQLPIEKRLLITNHESLNYFAERYGFTVAGTVISSFSSNAAPSAQQMADLIDSIKQLDAAAIFLDAADNDALARQIADETGVRVISDLYLESLTAGPPAATYIDLMRHNVAQIIAALK